MPDRVDQILDYIRELGSERDLTAKAVGLRLRRAAHYVDTETRRRLAPAGMELWEVEILAEIVRLGGVASIGRLQDFAQLTSGALTNRIARLEDKGFVTRAMDDQDRRQIQVAVTAAGRRR